MNFRDTFEETYKINKYSCCHEIVYYVYSNDGTYAVNLNNMPKCFSILSILANVKAWTQK